MQAYACFKRGVAKIARAFGAPFSLLTEPNLCPGELVVLATPLQEDLTEKLDKVPVTMCSV